MCFLAGGSGRFSIGCGSNFRAEVACLEVGSSDLEQIHENTIVDEMQFFLLVRGGLRREILVKNDILNFENMCFQSLLLVRGGLRRKILVENDLLKF